MFVSMFSLMLKSWTHCLMVHLCKRFAKDVSHLNIVDVLYPSMIFPCHKDIAPGAATHANMQRPVHGLWQTRWPRACMASGCTVQKCFVSRQDLVWELAKCHLAWRNQAKIATCLLQTCQTSLAVKANQSRLTNQGSSASRFHPS